MCEEDEIHESDIDEETEQEALEAIEREKERQNDGYYDHDRIEASKLFDN